MKTAAIVLSSLICALPGCANLQTVSRTTSLPKEGVAVHLDAPQRVVISDSLGRVCAEPTPDALQAYASALGLGLSVPSQGAVSFSNALQASSASIGLRTQSITLMRDVLYRICEASHNNQLAAGDLVQLYQRSQDLTLGVLAIEQLTGAVVARQAMLTGGANASASANIAGSEAALDAARKYEDAKRQASLDAQIKQKRDNDKLTDLKANLTAEQAKPAADQDAKMIKDLQDRIATQQAQVDADKIAATNAADDYTKAQTATAAIIKNLDAATTAATAAASGTGSFSTGTDRVTIDKDTVTQIAEATKYIVATVVNKGHLTDTCINLMTRYATEMDPRKLLALKPLNERCERIVATALAVYERQAGTGPATLPPPPPAPPAPPTR